MSTIRDVYRTTMTQAQADGTLKGLAGVEITVFLAGTATAQTIYQRETGAGEGPAPETGAVGAANSMTTVAGGAVEFWLPTGLFDIHVRDTIVPNRIMTRGYGSGNPPIQFNSMPASSGALPTSLLAQDAGLLLAHLGPAILRQAHQIGQVIDWWRPNSSVPVPTGFEICDGRVVTAANHEFPGVAGNITLPDLRNKFVMGADTLKADATPSTNGDSTAASGVQHPNAPGIGGAGGLNASKNLAHEHTVPGHKHTVSDPGHPHGVTDPGHGHTASGSGSLASRDISTWHVNPQGGYESWGSQWNTVPYDNTSTANKVAFGSGSYTSVASGKVSNAGVNVGVSVNGAGTGVSVNSAGTGITVGAGGSPEGNSPLATTGATIGTSIDMRPAHIGLLKLMKVRRS